MTNFQFFFLFFLYLIIIVIQQIKIHKNLIQLTRSNKKVVIIHLTMNLFLLLNVIYRKMLGITF